MAKHSAKTGQLQNPEQQLIVEQLKEVAQHKDPAAVAKREQAAQEAASEGAKAAQDVLLAQPWSMGNVTLRNRIVMPPMCMYSAYAQDGKPTNFHYQHYVSHAYGGFGMIIFESTAVDPEGRISPCDLGLWDDSQIDSYRWIVDGMKEAGTVPAIQLNHAGRKGSSGCTHLGISTHAYVPKDKGGWEIVGPSAIANNPEMPVPHVLTVDEIHKIVNDFRDAARRAVECGFQAIEIQAAHGYLLSQFFDPLTNIRNDEYGGSFENRIRLTVEVVDAVRSVMPEQMPLIVRVSATDWSQLTVAWRAVNEAVSAATDPAATGSAAGEAEQSEQAGAAAGEQDTSKQDGEQQSQALREEREYRKAVKKALPAGVEAAADAGGWDCDQTVELARILKDHGVDLMDVSTGGIISDVVMAIEPNYQVPYARRVHQEAQMPTTAVGLITKPKQAEQLLEEDDCTLVEIGRAALREPFWPIRALHKLGLPTEDIPYPEQYLLGVY